MYLYSFAICENIAVLLNCLFNILNKYPDTRYHRVLKTRERSFDGVGRKVDVDSESQRHLED